MISNKSNQADDDSQNNIDNQWRISETKDEEPMTFDKELIKVVQFLSVIKFPKRKQKSS